MWCLGSKVLPRHVFALVEPCQTGHDHMDPEKPFVCNTVHDKAAVTEGDTQRAQQLLQTLVRCMTNS
eukprot:6348969-Amphidinium_carterae.1